MNQARETTPLATLNLTTDPVLLPATVRFIGRLAEDRGLGTRAVRELELAVTEAIHNVLTHAFPGGKEASFTVICEADPEGLVVRVRDRGLPFQPGLERSQDARRGLDIMNEQLDSVAFRNLGHEGKELQLFKRKQTQHISRRGEGLVFDRESFSAEQLQVRDMTEADALEVSRCFYDVFGYDYGNDAVYYPERLVELNRAGLLHTIVAVTPEGYVLGTESLERPNSKTRVYEAGMVCVRPAARHFGIAKSMGAYLQKVLAREKILGIWAACVTSHVFSQKTLPPGCHPCALYPGVVPPDHTQDVAQAQRNSVLVVYKDLASKPLRPVLYPPPEHKEMIERILSGFGWQPEYREPERVSRVGPTEGHYDASRHKSRVVGTVTHIGEDFSEMMRERYNFFRTHDYAALYLTLPLYEPTVGQAYQELKELGSFFNGVLPGSGKGDARLLLGFLNNQILDYNAIHVLDEFGRELRDYIRDFDPELKKL